MEPAAECEECAALKNRYQVTLRAYIHGMISFDLAPHGNEFARSYESAERIRLNFDAAGGLPIAPGSSYVRQSWQNHPSGPRSSNLLTAGIQC
jgi:hypothetical protein